VEVNKQLDKMGYNIGLRLIEDYLAKSNTMRRCSNFRETAEMIAKVFRFFLLAALARSVLMRGIGWVQDLPKYYTSGIKLDERQQTVLSHIRGEPLSGLCRATR
jgi:hypothetical protein